MNDVERELREMLEHKAASVGGVAPRLPESVRTRSRRRQGAVATVGAVTLAAVALVSFAGLRALDLGSNDARVPGSDRSDRYEVFERTATIETVTITSPSDWYLVNQWPLGAGVATSTSAGVSCAIAVGPGETEPKTEACEGGSFSSPEPVTAPGSVPLLLLSRTDPGLGASPCLQGNVELANDAAMLEVAIDVRTVQQIEAGGGPNLPSWPVAFDEEAVTDGPCGPGHYVRFQVGSYPYLAWIGFGPETTDDVRRSLFDIADQMRFEDTRVARPADETPGYVIAAGENAAGPWRLELRPSTGGGPDANVDLHLLSAEGGAGTGNFTVPDATPIEQAGGDPTFGAVSKEATGVELRLEEGTPPIAATLVPLPPSLAYPFDLFFASNPSDVAPTAVPLGLGAPAPQPSPGAAVEASELRRVATGVSGGTTWALDYEEGRQLALVGDGDDILLDRIAPSQMASLSRANSVLIGTHDFGTTDNQRYLLYGVAHHDVEQLSIVFDDGRVITLERGTLRDRSIRIFGTNPNTSPGVWWVEMPPGPVVARLDAFDASCTEIGNAPVALQPSSADTSITAQAECVQGG